MNNHRKIRLMEFRSTYKWGGGPDKTVLNSAKLHDKSKFEITVVYLRSSKDKEFVLGERGRSLGINIIEIDDDSLIQSFKEVIKIIKNKKIDILHSRDYKTNFFSLLIGKFIFKNIKIVTTTHGWIGNDIKDWIYDQLDKLVIPFFDKIFMLYKKQKNQFFVKPAKKKIKIIYNAIDYREWNPSHVQKGRIRKELGISEDTYLMGYVGRIKPEKDLITLVRVLSKLINERRQKIKCIVVGVGQTLKYENKVRDEIDRCNLSSSVFFLGTRVDLREIYNDLNALIMTSLKEGFPNTLLEAIAMKVPSVVTAVGGIPEIIEHRKTGMLCKPRQVEEFTDCVEELIKNPKLGENIALNARRLVETELSFDKRLKKIEAEYTKLIAIPAS